MYTHIFNAWWLWRVYFLCLFAGFGRFLWFDPPPPQRWPCPKNGKACLMICAHTGVCGIGPRVCRICWNPISWTRLYSLWICLRLSFPSHRQIICPSRNAHWNTIHGTLRSFRVELSIPAVCSTDHSMRKSAFSGHPLPVLSDPLRTVFLCFAWILITDLSVVTAALSLFQEVFVFVAVVCLLLPSRDMAERLLNRR